MKPDELLAMVLERRDAGLDTVALVLVRKSDPAGEHVRLLGQHGGPKGEILNVRYAEDGVDVTAIFRVAEIHDWLVRGVLAEHRARQMTLLP